MGAISLSRYRLRQADDGQPMVAAREIAGRELRRDSVRIITTDGVKVVDAVATELFGGNFHWVLARRAEKLCFTQSAALARLTRLLPRANRHVSAESAHGPAPLP